MSNLEIKLTTLTPVHVGTGASLEPFEYVIRDSTLYCFTLEQLMLALPREAQAHLVEVVERSVPETRRFVAEQAATAVGIAQFEAAVSAAALETYERQMAGGLAHPEILPCIRTGSPLQPYLPGSSLKGALRTALLYAAMGQDNPARDARALEQEVFRFRTVQQDPFRALKIGDGCLLQPRTRVHAVTVNTRGDGGWREDLTVLVETVPGSLSDGQAPASEHLVTFDQDFYHYHSGAFALDAGAILAACREFYGIHLEAEQRYCQNLPAARAAYQALAAHAAGLPSHACLVRLAWGSGRDATTVAYGLRDGKRPRSRRLTVEGFPLGWAELALYDAAGQPVAAAPAAGPTSRQPQPPAPAGRRRLEDLQPGAILEGTVRRTTSYGAFVDVGIQRDGLIHISQLAGRFVQLVEEIVVAGDRVRVEVLDVDLARQRLALKLVEVL